MPGIVCRFHHPLDGLSSADGSPTTTLESLELDSSDFDGALLVRAFPIPDGNSML